MQLQENDLAQRDQDEHEDEYFCGVCGWVSITLFPNCHASQQGSEE